MLRLLLVSVLFIFFSCGSTIRIGYVNVYGISFSNIEIAIPKDLNSKEVSFKYYGEFNLESIKRDINIECVKRYGMIPDSILNIEVLFNKRLIGSHIFIRSTVRMWR